MRFLRHPPIVHTDKGELVFIHINKNAGTSISQAIGQKNIYHLTAAELIKILGPQRYENAHSFTVVRNPWDRVVSHYHFRVQTNQTKLKERQISFKDWLRNTYGPNPNPIYLDKPKMFMTQADWLKNSHGELQVKHILKFENVKSDFNDLMTNLNLKFTLEHYNRTDHETYHNYYDAESVLWIERYFKEDIRLFNYLFE